MPLDSSGGTDGFLPKVETTSQCDFVSHIVKSGVWPFDSSGDLVNLCHLDSIFEFDSRNHLGQVVEAA